MNKIYILLLALLVMAGCYKDKGNYDYKTMYAIEIDGIDENKKYELWFGEPFTMPEPIIRFTDSTQAHDDLSYQWKLDTVGGSLPEDLQEIKAACFIKNYSCLVSGSGKLYVRYSPGGYLYQDRYPDFPFYGDYKLSSVVGYSFPPDYNVALFYEENEGRYLFLDNGELRGLDQVEDAGQKFSLVDPDKELIYLAPASQQQGKSLFYAVLRDKSDGKYYTQRFQFGIVGGQPTLTTIAQDVFPAVVNEKTRFAVGYTTKEAYYSQGAQIFRYNFELNDTPVAVADFKTGTITAFTLDSYGEQFGVCVQNGNTHDFYWTSTDGQEFEHVKQIPGEVKGLIYKSGGSWKYE